MFYVLFAAKYKRKATFHFQHLKARFYFLWGCIKLVWVWGGGGLLVTTFLF